MVTPLRVSPRAPIEEDTAAPESCEYEELDDLDLADEDLVLEPPLARPPQAPLSLEAVEDREVPPEPEEQPAPLPRSITLGGLMLGTMLIAVCLGIGRASEFFGVVAFLVLIPAYIRTLSAIAFYRVRKRQLDVSDITSSYVTSAVLALMALLPGGFVYGVVAWAGAKIVQATGGEDSLGLTVCFATGAAFVVVMWMIHRVWPVNEN